MKTGPEACPIILFLQCTRFGNSIIPKRPPNFHFFLRPDAKYLNFTRIFFSKIEIGSDLADIGLKLTTKAAGSRIGVVERKAHKLKAKKNSGRWLLLPAALTLLLAGAAGWSLRGMSARELLAYAPENLWLAALMLIGCYPLKALSVFFPIAVLYLAAGLLFPLPAALLVTLAGSAAGYSLPWLIGRTAGGGLAGRMAARFPKLAPALALKDRSPVFFSYLLRVVGVIPFDLGSLLLGACGAPFLRGLLGSWMGLLPGILTNLLLAEQLDKGINTAYLILMAVLTALSLLLTAWGRRQMDRWT